MRSSRQPSRALSEAPSLPPFTRREAPSTNCMNHSAGTATAFIQPVACHLSPWPPTARITANRATKTTSANAAERITCGARSEDPSAGDWCSERENMTASHRVRLRSQVFYVFATRQADGASGARAGQWPTRLTVRASYGFSNRTIDEATILSPGKPSVSAGRPLRIGPAGHGLRNRKMHRVAPREPFCGCPSATMRGSHSGPESSTGTSDLAAPRPHGGSRRATA